MGRKKIGVVSQAQESFEIKPFCYYCDREFDTAKTLITHQRTKHFNCGECGLKFDTVTGLRVHMLNAYKKTMKEVPNAMPGRENPDIVVHGMEGLPKGLLEERTRKAMVERAEKEKIREEESKERLKQISAARAAEARADNEDDKAPPPPEPKRLAPAPASPPQPPAPAPPQPDRRPPQPPPAGGLGPGGMPGLSPAVQRLLSGIPEPRHGPPAVPGLIGHHVPPALSGLHPVALQVLAFAGALPAKGMQPYDTSRPMVGLPGPWPGGPGGGPGGFHGHGTGPMPGHGGMGMGPQLLASPMGPCVM